MNKKLLDSLLSYEGKGDYLALATLIDSSGSSPRNAGAQMLVYPDGSIEGTIGGGPSEAETIEKAKELMKKGENGRFKFEFTNEEIAAAGGICGGEIIVFIETIRSF